MNDEPTGEASTNEPTTDWERLRRVSDADIHAVVASEPDITSSLRTRIFGEPPRWSQCKPTIIIRLDAREEAIADSKRRSPIMD